MTGHQAVLSLSASARPTFPVPVLSVLALMPLFCPSPGDIALDLPQGPALVDPVTFLPPPPLPKGAAHMQATALVKSQNRPTDTPMAMPPPRQHAPPDTWDWSFPPTLQPQRPAEVAIRNTASTEASYSFPSATNPGGGLSLTVNLRSQSIINRSRCTNTSTVLPHFIQRPLARVLPTHGISERTQSKKTQVPATSQEPATSHVFGMGKEPLIHVFAVSQEPVIEQSNISVVGQESSMGQEHPVDRESEVNKVPAEGQELFSVIKSSLLRPTKEAGEVQQLNLKVSDLKTGTKTVRYLENICATCSKLFLFCVILSPDAAEYKPTVSHALRV